MKKQADKYFCDFCGKSQYEVELMIAGPNGHAICGYCTEIAMDIVNESGQKAQLAKDNNPHSD